MNATSEQACEMIERLTWVLDDGQEVKMFKLVGGYCVTIHGDCFCESRNKPTLAEAVDEAAQKYTKWFQETITDEHGHTD